MSQIDAKSMAALTDAQFRVWKFYLDRHAATGFWPSFREVQKALRFKSPQAVVSHVKAIIAKGLMVQGRSGTARNLIALPSVGAKLCPTCGRPHKEVSKNG